MNEELLKDPEIVAAFQQVLDTDPVIARRFNEAKDEDEALSIMGEIVTPKAPVQIREEQESFMEGAAKVAAPVAASMTGGALGAFGARALGAGPFFQTAGAVAGDVIAGYGADTAMGESSPGWNAALNAGLSGASAFGGPIVREAATRTFSQSARPSFQEFAQKRGALLSPFRPGDMGAGNANAFVDQMTRAPRVRDYLGNERALPSQEEVLARANTFNPAYEGFDPRALSFTPANAARPEPHPYDRFEESRMAAIPVIRETRDAVVRDLDSAFRQIQAVDRTGSLVPTLTPNQIIDRDQIPTLQQLIAQAEMAGLDDQAATYRAQLGAINNFISQPAQALGPSDVQRWIDTWEDFADANRMYDRDYRRKVLAGNEGGNLPNDAEIAGQVEFAKYILPRLKANFTGLDERIRQVAASNPQLAVMRPSFAETDPGYIANANHTISSLLNFKALFQGPEMQAFRTSTTARETGAVLSDVRRPGSAALRAVDETLVSPAARAEQALNGPIDMANRLAMARANPRQHGWLAQTVPMQTLLTSAPELGGALLGVANAEAGTIPVSERDLSLLKADKNSVIKNVMNASQQKGMPPQMGMILAATLHEALSAQEPEEITIQKVLPVIKAIPEAFVRTQEGYGSLINGQLHDPMEISLHLKKSLLSGSSPSEEARNVGKLLSEKKYTPINQGAPIPQRMTPIVPEMDLAQLEDAMELDQLSPGTYGIDDTQNDRFEAQEEEYPDWY